MLRIILAASTCSAQDLFIFTDSAAFAPRDATVVDGHFVNRSGVREQLRGSNVVVKGPPWLPAVSGNTRCGLSGTLSCKTFNEQDAKYFKSQGFNFIRLGVIWAGGQPNPAAELAPDFVSRLHALLELCQNHGIRVILDVHQDAMGTAMCGEGVPMWYSQKHLPHLIGMPVVGLTEKFLGTCSDSDVTSWRQHAGDPNYNVLNECCIKLNDPGAGWGMKLDPALQVQLTFAHVVGTSAGRQAYSAYVGMLARAVAQHPAAIGIELMNEPPFMSQAPFETRWLYELYKDCYDAVRAVSAELAVGIVDEGSVAKYADDDHVPSDIRSFLRNDATHLFYAFHWYHGGVFPPDIRQSIANAKSISALWKAAPVITEFPGRTMDLIEPLDEADISWAYYEYNSYCTVPDRGSNCSAGMPCAFGACIT